jgi:hypothetical protein
VELLKTQNIALQNDLNFSQGILVELGRSLDMSRDVTLPEGVDALMADKVDTLLKQLSAADARNLFMVAEVEECKTMQLNLFDKIDTLHAECNWGVAFVSAGLDALVGPEAPEEERLYSGLAAAVCALVVAQLIVSLLTSCFCGGRGGQSDAPVKPAAFVPAVAQKQRQEQQDKLVAAAKPREQSLVDERKVVQSREKLNFSTVEQKQKQTAVQLLQDANLTIDTSFPETPLRSNHSRNSSFSSDPGTPRLTPQINAYNNNTPAVNTTVNASMLSKSVFLDRSHIQGNKADDSMTFEARLAAATAPYQDNGQDDSDKEDDEDNDTLGALRPELYALHGVTPPSNRVSKKSTPSPVKAPSPRSSTKKPKFKKRLSLMEQQSGVGAKLATMSPLSRNAKKAISLRKRSPSKESAESSVTHPRKVLSPRSSGRATPRTRGQKRRTMSVSSSMGSSRRF